MAKLALIRNPGSGSAGEANVGELLAAEGHDVADFEISAAGDAVESGAERVLVAGGDGSIAPAAEAARDLGVPLGVIPSGTANDFARRMGLPSDIEEAARLAAAGGEIRGVDLAAVGDRRFVNAASLGLAPAAAEAAESLKDSLGALAYTVGALQAGSSEEPFPVVVRCAGELLYEGECWQVTIGCTGAFGGGSNIDADADDGQLDVVVIEGGPRARLAKHAVGMRAGKVEEQEGVRSARCETIEIGLESPRELNVDGELVEPAAAGGEDAQLSFGVEHEAIRLVVG